MEGDKPSLESLMHVGVLGMKWGQHKQKEASYRQKLSNIQKNKNLNISDAKRFKDRNHSAAVRATKMASGIIAQKVITDVLLGRGGKYLIKDPKYIAKMATDVAVRVAANMAVQDALAKSASKRYDDNGKKLRPSGVITKEDLIEGGIKTAMIVAPIAARLGKMKMSQISKKHKQNEERFKSWGGNILPEKVNNVIWNSDDHKMGIIDGYKKQRRGI